MDKHTHPMVISTIYDQSTPVTDSNAGTGTTVFAPFISDIGPANQIVPFVGQFGTPDHRRHGLSQLLAMRASQAGALVYALRVVPKPDPIGNPDIVPASLANAFLDIQTKYTPTASADSAKSIGTADIVLDTNNSGECLVTGEEGGSLVTATLEPGSTVYWQDAVTLTADSSDQRVSRIIVRYFITSNNISTLGLLNEQALTVEWSDGTVASATVSATNENLSKYGFIIDSDTDLSVVPSGATETVTIKKSGSVVGTGTIQKIGEVSHNIVKATILGNTATFTGSANDLANIVIGETTLTGVDLSEDVSIADVVATINAAYLAQSGSASAVAEVDSGDSYLRITDVDGGIGGTVTITPTDADTSDPVKDLFGSSVVTNTSQGFQTANLKYGCDLNIQHPSIVDNDYSTYTLFGQLPIREDTLWVVEDAVELGFVMYMDNGRVTTNVKSQVTGTTKVSGDDTWVIDPTLGISITRPQSLPSGAVAMFQDYEGHGPIMEVRPVITNKTAYDKSELESYIDAPSADPFINVTSDGYTRHVIFGLSHQHSIVSNGLGMAITSESSQDSLEGARTFKIQYTETISGVTRVVDGPYVVSFDPTAKDAAGNSLWIGTVMDNFVSGFDFYHNTDSYMDLLEDLEEAAEADGAVVNPIHYDFITATERDADTSVLEQQYIKIVDDAPSAAIIGGSATVPRFKEGLFTKTLYSIVDGELVTNFDASGFLGLGSSGSLDGYDANGTALSTQEMNDLKESLIVDAYDGKITNQVFDSVRFPMHLIFESMNTVGVKLAIDRFLKDIDRGNTMCFMDLGYSPTYLADISTRGNELATIDQRRIVLYGQNGVVYDSNTESNFTTSAVYDLADYVTRNHVANKAGQSMANKLLAILGSFKDGSLSYSPDRNQKTGLRNKQINYAVEENGVVSLRTHDTSQKKRTALSDAPTVLEILKMKTEMDSKAGNHQQLRYADSIAGVQADINEIAKRYLKTGTFSRIVATVGATAYEIGQRKMRMSLKMDTNKFVETILLDWIVVS